MIINSIKVDKKELNKHELEVYCPICKLGGLFALPENIGSNLIWIPRDFVCEHQFQIFLDKHFNVSGYQTFNFEFEDGLVVLGTKLNL